MRPRPPILKALGRSEPPAEILVDGQSYRFRELYKHDSWAATALYERHAPQGSLSGEASERRIVCKLNRIQPILGVPMQWLGRWLAARERRAYQDLDAVSGVATDCGIVHVGDKTLRHAVAHDYIAGRPLRIGETLGQDFFPQLNLMLSRIHEAGYAYVDLHKRENVLVGDDGRPYLIDFQVSYRLGSGILSRLWASKSLLRLLQSTDRFCLYKHVRQFHPEQIAALDLGQYTKIPWWIRLHRLVAVPFRQARRKLLSWLSIRDRSGMVSSESFVEHGLRES